MRKHIVSRLKVGDIVVVSTMLGREREYPVLRVEGHKAYTEFRCFNTAVYYNGAVYEFGNKNTTNGYWLKKEIG